MAERGTQFEIPASKFHESEAMRQDAVGLFLEKCQKVAGLSAIKPSPEDFSYLSPEQRAESLWAIFQDVKGLVSGRKAKGGAVEVVEFKEKVAILKNLYEDPAARGAYIAGSEKCFKEIDSINGNYEKYQALNEQIKMAQDIFDATARQMFSSRSERADEAKTLMFEVNKRKLFDRRKQLDDLISASPEIGSLIQHETLKEYSKQLWENDFIWSPSRREALEEIVTAALSGKPLLISGETGTGKTRLFEEAAFILTGMAVSPTPGKDVRFEKLIAERDIGSNGQPYYNYKEIGEAATGKTSTLDKVPKHDGGAVADDEFNLRPPADQTEMMARIAAWSSGKKVRMPVTNEEVIIAPNFLFCAMINLASERYERKKIPPEVLRKFTKVNLDYPPQSPEEPEIYEMMLAALIDENGRMRAAKSELAPAYTCDKEVKKPIERGGETVKATVQVRELADGGGFLWRFAQALGELNKSFSRRETVLKKEGEAQYIKGLVIDIGDATGYLKEYRKSGGVASLESFVVEKLKKQFLDKKEYAVEDRQLVKEFLKHFKINADNPPSGEEQSKKEQPKFENLTPVEIGLLSPRVKYEKILSEEPELAEGFFIDNSGERVGYLIKPVEKDGIHYTPNSEAPAGHFIKRGGKLYEFLGVTKEGGEPVFSLCTPRGKRGPERAGKTESRVDMDRAREIMGPDFFGQEAIEQTFGPRLEDKDIPAIPFTEAELERAKELGQFLILRVKETGGKKPLPLTAENMNNILSPQYKKAKKGKILYNNDWCKNEDFYKKDVPQTGWALVSRENIPNSTGKNYLEQTQEIVNYAANEIHKNAPIPQETQEAIDEFNNYYAQNFQNKTAQDMQALLSGQDWPKYAQELSQLKINRLFRRNFAETLYDSLVFSNNTQARPFEKLYTWTSARSSSGRLVDFGGFGADGANVDSWGPDDSSGFLGVSFSRSH